MSMQGGLKMSIETNKAFIRRYLEAIRKDKSPATLDTYMTDEVLKQHIIMSETAFPGFWIEAEEILAEEDRVNMRGKIHGVHKGPMGNIPASGKEVTVTLFITYRIVDGKIAEHWILSDDLSLLQQIGAIPAPT
jgi:predicted ester cyclase